MRDSYLEEFYSFLRFPSVSTDDQYAVHVRDCARWLSQKLSAIGLKSQVVPTAGHPVVWAHNDHREGRPTVLIYGHYDVQPPDPLELWESPPFEPVLKNGYVFARGATDNKGQILAHILGIQETIEQSGDLPVNVEFVIEGEEEVGSQNLPKFLQQNRDALKCDVVLVSDTGMIAPGTPTLSYGLRGVAALRNMVLLRKGSRLSVQPVTAREFEVITRMAGSKQAPPSAGMRKKRTAKKKPHQSVARSKPAKRNKIAGHR